MGSTVESEYFWDIDGPVREVLEPFASRKWFRLLLLFVGNCKKKNSWTVIRFSTHGELILMGHCKLYAICECLIENLFRVCRPHHHFNCRLSVMGFGSHTFLHTSVFYSAFSNSLNRSTNFPILFIYFFFCLLCSGKYSCSHLHTHPLPKSHNHRRYNQGSISGGFLWRGAAFSNSIVAASV